MCIFGHNLQLYCFFFGEALLMLARALDIQKVQQCGISLSQRDNSFVFVPSCINEPILQCRSCSARLAADSSTHLQALPEHLRIIERLLSGRRFEDGGRTDPELQKRRVRGLQSLALSRRARAFHRGSCGLGHPRRMSVWQGKCKRMRMAQRVL